MILGRAEKRRVELLEQMVRQLTYENEHLIHENRDLLLMLTAQTSSISPERREELSKKAIAANLPVGRGSWRTRRAIAETLSQPEVFADSAEAVQHRVNEITGGNNAKR